MKIRAYLLIIFITAKGLACFAQNDSTFLSGAARSLAGYAGKYPAEKVYLHLDKPFYNPRDTIWFKAYIVIGEHHQLSALSGVLYCELVNPKDSVVSRHILNMTAGAAWGNFVLGAAFKPGNYHLRAYTNWMRNDGPGFFYNQTIQVGVSQLVGAADKTASPAHPDVQFFPEGGQLVNGLRCRVAVKAINVKGLGEDITGSVEDDAGNVIADFATQHLGMGVFALTPKSGKTYRAKINIPGETAFTIELPKAREEGFVLTVNNSGPDSIYLKIAANDKLFQEKQNSAFYLVGQSAGKIYYTTQSKLAGPVFTAAISKDRFPSGIVQFTLFSQSGEPLNERVIFVQSDDTLKMALASSQAKYATREKVKIDLSAMAPGKQATMANFSVAVTNESRVPVNENAESTLLNNLLLISDIKGYVEQPNYYFNQGNSRRMADLDVLMLTQGYRRFEWKQVLSNAPHTLDYQPEKSLALQGTLKTPSGKIVPNGKVTLLSTGQGFLADTVTDALGNFKFANLEFPDTARVVLRARKASNGSNVAIYVKQSTYPPVIHSDINTDTITRLSPQMLANLARYRQQQKEDSLKNGRHLKEVQIKEKKDPKPDRYNRYGTALEYDADMKRLKGENNLGDALAMLIPGASYRSGKISYEFNTVRLIIDGMEFSNNQLNLYSPRELDDIRMISATNVSPAMLVITTKRAAGTDTASTMLREVVIKDKKVNKGPDLSRSQSLHPGAADQVLMGESLGGCADLSDCLTGKISFVHFDQNGSPYNHDGSMSVIVDGNVLDGSHLNDITAADIYSIEVLRTGAAKAIYGSSIAKGGALVITMKHGGESSYVTSVAPAGLITYPFKGFYKAKSFYSPKYTRPKTDIEPFDLRSTIYWNPNINTDKSGKASFEYFNNDTKGTYRVVVEGIDDDGNLGRAVYRYVVE